MISDLSYRLRAVFRRDSVESEMDEELRAHVERQAEKYIQSGMSREEALRKARIEFGGVEQIKEEVRDARGVSFIETTMQDLRYSLRTLAKTPGFTAVTVLTLALGIGATTAIFTVVRSVLLRPLPFQDSSRLVRLYEQNATGEYPYNYVAGGVFAEWKKQNHGFSDIALVSNFAEYSLSATGGNLPERVHAAECSWNLFSVLGIEPALGRTFDASEDRQTANATVILSWGLWKRRFGGDPSILNQTIRLDAKPYTVVGVMPSDFAFPSQAAQLWTPIYHEEMPSDIQAIDSHDFAAVGRLRPGVTEAEATAELSVIVRRLHDEHRDDPFVSIGANSRPLLEGMVGDVRTPLYVLLAATGCLLLIACLNVSSLMVARGAARQKELAIRTALGGSRWRLLSGQLMESFLLSAAGAGVGLPAADAAIRWFVATRQDMNRVESIRMDVWVAGFVVALVLACALFACLASSISIRGGQILAALQESARSHSGGQARVRLRKALLMAEVGLTVLLLVGAGLLLKSYERMRSSDLGCFTKNVLTMRLSLPQGKYTQGVQRVNFYETLLERVRTLPGIEGAGIARVVPGQGYGGDSGFAVAEHPPLPLGKAQYAMVRWADRGYFSALGIPLLRGKTFDESKRLENALEAIVSQSFARQFFPGEDPVGKHLVTLGKHSFEIVGVAGDTRFNAVQPIQPMMYFPLYASFYDGVPTEATLAVRSNRDVPTLALPVQRIIQDIDSEL
ncbi:MAG TPA: ABC transporter permease, partial [Terriglobia bacterium]|nr:ABC transporter permease [Terriglobia bacterium]